VVPIAAVLAVALTTLGGAALVTRQAGGGAGPATDTASTSGLPAVPSAGTARGPGVVAGASTTSRSSRSGGAAEARLQDLRRLVTRVRVPATARPARDAAGVTVSYTGSHLVDGDPSTAWRMRGDGRGRTLTVTFSRPVRLAKVGLVNGYAKVDAASGTDRYAQQRRVTRVVWRAGGVGPVTQALVDGARTPQLVAMVTPPIRTLTVTILATAPGNPHFDYTALGEIALEGP
jgi:hypothetical protein